MSALSCIPVAYAFMCQDFYVNRPFYFVFTLLFAPPFSPSLSLSLSSLPLHSISSHSLLSLPLVPPFCSFLPSLSSLSSFPLIALLFFFPPSLPLLPPLFSSSSSSLSFPPLSSSEGGSSSRLSVDVTAGVREGELSVYHQRGRQGSKKEGMVYGHVSSSYLYFLETHIRST